MGKGWIWTAVLTAAIGLGSGTAAGYALSGNEDRYATLPDAMTVGGLAVGGLTADEALAAIRAREEALEATAVLVDGNAVAGFREGEGEADGLAPTLRQLGMTVDAAEAVGALEAYRDANWRQRGKLRNKLKSDYEVNVSWDAAAFLREAEAVWGDRVAASGRDAARTITASDEVVYAPETLGAALDADALMASIVRLAPASLAPGADEIASDGLRTLGVELPTRQVAPKVTEASLKAEGIDRKIAEFATSFATSAEGRSHNVSVTAKALDGTLLNPGDVFDYGRIVSKAEKNYGYQEAPVIVNGKLTPGIGGGICQVSSTLYNAVIRTAGLDIVERRNHSLPVHYLPAGLDATFADGYINFRFRNSTGKQLLIKTEVKNKQLTVKLFGTMDERVSYEIETVQKKIIAPKVVYVADRQVAEGKSQVRQQGETGYAIDTYRVKLVDGKFISREKLATSTYKSQDEIVAVSPGDPRVPPADNGKNGTPPKSGDGPVEPV